MIEQITTIASADKTARLAHGTIVRVVPGTLRGLTYTISGKANGKLFTIIGDMEWKYGYITYVLKPYKFRGKNATAAFIEEATQEDIVNYNPYQYA
jgi:hypothetical protein